MNLRKAKWKNSDRNQNSDYEGLGYWLERNAGNILGWQNILYVYASGGKIVIHNIKSPSNVHLRFVHFVVNYLNKINRRKIPMFLSMAARTVMTCFLSTFLCSSLATPFSFFNQLLNQLFPGHNICLFTVEKKCKGSISLFIYILSQPCQANSNSSLKIELLCHFFQKPSRNILHR